MPFASIIIPTYNRKEFVTETILSVTSQTHIDIEIIVVDDGSADGTKEFLKEFIDRGDIIYQWQENAGRSAARNHGARLSTGDFLMFLDSDDLLDPKAIENLYHLHLAHPKSGVLSGLVGFFTSSRKPWYDHTFNYAADVTDNLLNAEYFVSIGAYLVKREIYFGTNGFDKDFEPAEDLEYSFRILHGTLFTWAKNLVVVNKRRHEENTDDTKLSMASYKTSIRFAHQLKENKFPVYNSIRKKQIAAFYYRAFNDCCYLNWKAKGLKNFLLMIRTNPALAFKFESWKLLAYLFLAPKRKLAAK